MRIHCGDCPPCQEWHWQPLPDSGGDLPAGILSTNRIVADEMLAEIARLRRELTARGLAHVAQPTEGHLMAKSTYSGADSCVDVEIKPDVVVVRNTNHPKRGSTLFTHAEWAAFILGAKAGEFDLPDGGQ